MTAAILSANLSTDEMINTAGDLMLQTFYTSTIMRFEPCIAERGNQAFNWNDKCEAATKIMQVTQSFSYYFMKHQMVAGPRNMHAKR